MSKNLSNIRPLRQALAVLYPKESDARRVAYDVGLALEGIEFGGSARTFWHAILVEAAKHELVGTLVAIALDEYPNNKPLLTAGSSWRAATRGPSAPPACAVSIARLPVVGRHFVGRTTELSALSAAWEAPSIHIVSVVAWGGTGKSSLVGRWLAQRAALGWPDVARVFGWSFYSQGTRADGASSSDAFIAEALVFFGDPEPITGSPWQKGERLAQLIRRQPSLLVLDGIEPLQEPESVGGRLRDPALGALLRELAASMTGMCIVTTRQPVAELAHYHDTTVRELDLTQLDESAGAELLRRWGVIGPDEELRIASREVNGHALTLALLGGYIRAVLGRDVRRRGEARLARERSHRDHAHRLMCAYDLRLGVVERALLRVMGLFDRPVGAECLGALRRAPAISGVTDVLVDLGAEAWGNAVDALREAGLMALVGEHDDGSLDTHPLVRECFGELLREENPSGYCLAHGRLYEHLRDTAPQFPDTLDGLQPLYQAVWHGCRAGRHKEALEEVFLPRIQRGDEHFSGKQLGAHSADLGALAGMFDGNWTRPAADLGRAGWGAVLNITAFALRALGRLREAVAPTKAAVDTYVAQENWLEAGIDSSNLADLHCARGTLREALAAATKAVAYADRSGDVLERMSNRAYRARVLHLLGCRDEAHRLFIESELIQQTDQPQYPVLFGVRGAWFCDFLLDSGSVREVMERALSALPINERNRHILATALSHLSLARVCHALCNDTQARIYFAQALDGLRVACQQDELAPALIYRAAFYREVGDGPAAYHDLTEAIMIATRCEMLLVECDARLEEARQAIAAGQHEAALVATSRARQIVDQCAYGRRADDVRLLETTL